MKHTRTRARIVQTPWQPELFAFPKKGRTFPKFAIGKEQLAAVSFLVFWEETSSFMKKRRWLLSSLNLTFLFVERKQRNLALKHKEVLPSHTAWRQQETK